MEKELEQFIDDSLVKIMEVGRIPIEEKEYAIRYFQEMVTAHLKNKVNLKSAIYDFMLQSNHPDYEDVN